MTYDNSTIWWVKSQQRDKQVAFILALTIHVLLFLIGGAMFIKTAKFSVQQVSETTEVTLVDTVEEPSAEMVEALQPIQKKQEELVKVPQKINQGVKVEANPNYFQNSPPPYPELAKQMHQEGLVVLDVDVDKEGIPITVEIKQSSGYRLLDQAALKAVSHWKFQPGRFGDLSVESRVNVPVRFRLEESNANSIRDQRA